MNLIITCEHGGNQIPPAYRKLFRGSRAILESHRGHDPGALQLAKLLAKSLHAPLIFSTTSRLLIELNRTLGHPRIFSEFSRVLSIEEQQQLIDEFYVPYRTSVEESIRLLVRSGPVLHVSVHSFTPILNEKTRRTDVGLLFDPARTFESSVCQAWRRGLRLAAPEVKTHFNLPYRGTSDGFTVFLRKQFPDRDYAGIEIEVNQKFPLAGGEPWKSLQRVIADTLGAFSLPTSPR